MDISILTYNLAMVPNYLFFWGGKYLKQRTEILLHEVKKDSNKYQVLCFQEIFRESIRRKIYKHLADHYPYITAKKGDDVFGGQDSGLFFASKFPIINTQLRQDFVKFSSHKASLWDRHTAKGVLASCIQVTPKKMLWIFNTHLQSGNHNRHIRQGQMKTVVRFIQSNLATLFLMGGKIMDHSIIFLGDLNIEGDTDHSNSEYLEMLKLLHNPHDLFRRMNKHAPGYTWNSKENLYLKKQYKRDRSMQRLDYIFSLTSLNMGHPQGIIKLNPITCKSCRLVKLKSKNIDGIQDGFDLSDHYGVAASIFID
jgi:endonuclease/exonuclease/phosphatase family metal-dependent hydrolase